MKKNTIYKTLNEFGLNDNEITVYLECLKHETGTPFTIAKSTKIPRTTVYDVLLNLSLKGLIELEQSDGFTKQQTKVKAKNPYVIRKILAKKRRKLFELETDILQFLPFVKSDFLENRVSRHVEFFDGVEGMKKVYMRDNELIGKGEVYCFENFMPVDVLSHEEINKDVDKASDRYKKDDGKYPIIDIIILNDWAKHCLTYQCGRNPRYLEKRNFRYLDDIGFEFRSRIAIAGNHVRVATSNEDEVWGMIIDSGALADSLKALFMYLWVSAKPVTKELVASWGENELLSAQSRRRKR